MQKTQDRKRQREEDEEEEAGHGPAFSVNPDSLGAHLPHSKSSLNTVSRDDHSNFMYMLKTGYKGSTGPLKLLVPRHSSQFTNETLLIKRSLCHHTDVSSGAGMKTGKSSKIDRITHILEGRKDSKFEHDGHAGGLTNKEKLRKKNFIMVRKGKKSVNNKSRKAAGLDRHEKNTAVSLLIRLSFKVSSPMSFVYFDHPFEPR